MTVLGPETQIAGRYQLQYAIGSGPIGEVWCAQDEQLSRPVALKLVRTELAGHPAFLDGLRDEARAWAAVCHPGVAWVFDFGEQAADGPAGATLVYLVMELVDGRPVDSLIEEGEPLPVVETLDLVAQAASTLHAAHQRALVHGNLKPSNLLLRSDGVLKVSDFGIARAFGAVSLSEARDDLDNACWRSPEQVAGKDGTVASDLYSLGIVTYLLLTGELPFTAEGPISAAVEQLTERPRPLPDRVPSAVSDLVCRMLSKDPSERPPHAGALAAEAVALCQRLGRRTTRPARELLGGDAARLA
jgi:eukaryotic-like serine/threonine-protein kinase